MFFYGTVGSSETLLQSAFSDSQTDNGSIGPGHAKMCLMPYANNKGADQAAHPRSLISTFVFAA